MLAIIKIFLSFEPNFMGCPREKNLREGGGGVVAGLDDRGGMFMLNCLTNASDFSILADETLT